jgi:hypothetical protein
MVEQSWHDRFYCRLNSSKSINRWHTNRIVQYWLTHSNATCAPLPCAISASICAANFVQLSPVISFVHCSRMAMSNNNFNLDAEVNIECSQRSKTIYFRRRTSSSRAVNVFVRSMTHSWNELGSFVFSNDCHTNMREHRWSTRVLLRQLKRYAKDIDVCSWYVRSLVHVYLPCPERATILCISIVVMNSRWTCVLPSMNATCAWNCKRRRALTLKPSVIKWSRAVDDGPPE